tara:strand:+ start:280 stop:546 length:267 start_codon:yes stop_codon:yes gene_type:complete
MKPLIDNTSIVRLLKNGLRTQRPGAPKGVMLWDLEDLDEPSPGWKYCQKVDRASFPKGYQGIKHSNLARESPVEEAVDFGPDAHDFTK